MRRSLFFSLLVFGSLVLNGCGGRGMQIFFDNTPTAPAPTEVAFVTPTTAAAAPIATPTPVVIVVTATPSPVVPPTETPDSKVEGHVRSTATVTAPTATSQVTSIAEGENLVEDDFSSNRNNWWEGQVLYEEIGEITGQLVEGKYHLSLKAKGAYFDRLILPDFSEKDFYISIKAKVVELTGPSGYASVGLILRHNEAKDEHYVVEFWNNGDCTLQVLHNGEWVHLALFTDANTFELVPGVENTFAVSVKDSSFTIYANGQYLGTANDVTLDQGGEVGLSLNLQEANQLIRIELDDLIIKKLNS